MGTGSFPGVKIGRGVRLTLHPLLVPLVMKEWSYSSTPPMGRTACTEPQCLYKGDLYLCLTRQTTWSQTVLKLLYCSREFQFIYTKHLYNPFPVAARSKSWVCVPLACWDCGFDSRRRSLMSVSCGFVCCQVKISATGLFTRPKESYRMWFVLSVIVNHR